MSMGLWSFSKGEDRAGHSEDKDRSIGQVKTHTPAAAFV